MNGYDSFCCFRSDPNSESTRMLWELNTTCNLQCNFCHTVSERQNSGRSFNEITSDMERLVKKNIDGIIFSGGEPLLRSDLLDILCAAKEKGFEVDLCTNGTLINSNIALQLAKYLSEISVSLDSAIPEVHDRIRGYKGAHSRTVLGIKALEDVEVSVHAISLVNKYTIRSLLQTIEMLEELSVESVTLLGEMATFHYSSPSRSVLDEHLRLEEKIRELRNIANIPINTKRLFPPKSGDVCPAGNGIIGMDVKGKLLPCILFKWGNGRFNIESWREQFEDAIHDNFSSCHLCNSCGGGCPGSSVLATGRINVDQLCCVPYRKNKQCE